MHGLSSWAAGRCAKVGTMDAPLVRLYPRPSIERPLAGTYLAHDLRALGAEGRPYIYANFVTTLDGRTSQIDRETGRQRPPPAIPHTRDWRLYRELAAQADAVVTSSSRLLAMLGENRAEIQCVEGIEEGEAGAWRSERGLPPRPTCVVLSKKLESGIARLLEMPRAKSRCSRAGRRTRGSRSVCVRGASRRAWGRSAGSSLPRWSAWRWSAAGARST